MDSEWTSKKEQLKEIKVMCQKLIEERERGQLDISKAVKSFKSSAQEAVENTEKVFTELICSLEKKRSEIKEQIRAQEKTEIDRAEKLHKHLDQELTELRRRQTEIEKLLITDDQVNFLKSCQSVCVLPTFEDIPSITQHTHLSFKDISISAFREVLEDVCQQQTARISQEVSNILIVEPPKPETPNQFLQSDRSYSRHRPRVSVANQRALALRDVTLQLARGTKAVRAPRSSPPDATEKTHTRSFLALNSVGFSRESLRPNKSRPADVDPPSVLQ
ncbi:hypothetical protein G5714_015389 [Onychostoma macrolepis]|uniref:TRIM8/14/16/25/29/45/65 coiled-coil region domain-containing protein n=1 Tax=Onychostoma macrolepis TaxID=369639 RepID=A0A7J6CF32_9TELE|nr:hypothetical protein G5714_015389 [Onychostoma macrolepis]